MGFSDIIDIVSNLSLIGGKDSKPKRPKIYILFLILLAPSVLWFLIELNSIWHLPSPILFIVIFVGIGIIFSIGTIILMYKLGLIEELSAQDVFTILIPATLLTVSIASFVNRTYGIIF